MYTKANRALLASIVALMLCSVVGLAQFQNGANGPTVEIHGQVRFVEGGAPAANVLVRLESFDSGGSISESFTDRLGKFSFTGLQPAQYSVKIHQSGYRDAQQTVDMQTTSSGLVMLQLAKESVAANKSVTGSIDANVPPGAQKEFDKGVVALGEGGKDKTQIAVQHFEKAVSMYPKFVAAQLKLGTALMDLEQWEKAEQALRTTLEMDPQAAIALFALSEIYLRQNKVSDAEKVVTQGLAIEDRSFRGHLNLARVNWERARTIRDLNQARPTLEKAYEEVKQALSLNPNLAAAHLLKGNLLLRVGRTTDALAEFDEYLRVEPTGALANETRALVDKIRKQTSKG